jgi:hypothetical protein
MSNRTKVALLVAIAALVSACGDCDRADQIAHHITEEWEQDSSKFGPGTAPCALPSNAAEILGPQRVSEYEDACAKYRESADGC